MSRTNIKTNKSRIGRAFGRLFGITHEGAPARRIDPELALRRSVMSSLLWEDQYYESGQTIAERVASLIPLVAPQIVADLAIESRERMKLRHMPLLICREMLRHNRHKALVAETLERVIQRPDELAEFLAIYWRDGKRPLAAQVKRGLANAFTKFDEYQLAKYNRKAAIRLRDVLFLTHAKPKDRQQAAVWRRLVEGTLAVPDTWEVELSATADKLASWERLLHDERLGALALIRNLRGMTNAGVDQTLISGALRRMKAERVLPFRFIAAARQAPDYEPELEEAMIRCLHSQEKLKGKTVLLVDVSGSMIEAISARSDQSRMEAACGLAILVQHICERTAIYTFSNDIVRVAPRSGFALRDAIVGSQDHRGTYLGSAVTKLHRSRDADYDRLIILTDEQTADTVENPLTERAYMINVASYQHGIGYGPWVHIDGWSESVIDYIREFERPPEERFPVRRRPLEARRATPKRRPARKRTVSKRRPVKKSRPASKKKAR